MNTTSTAPPLSMPAGAPAAARTVLRLLQRLRHGSLNLQLPDGSTRRFGARTDARPRTDATLRLHNWKACAAALRSGDIGFAESYIAGDWSTPDMVALLDLLLRNRAYVEDVIYGSWAGRLLYRIKHLLHRNTRHNSRKNIHAHYDLGNAFYELWLDDSMNYSSAWFNGNPDQPLRDAQDAKVRRTLRMAGVQAGDRVLEIGCGWGALAEMASLEFQASVTGVTLSTEQLTFAQQRLQRLDASANLRLQDYRDIGSAAGEAPFDAICSIEMVEAVGREYWPTYFQSLHRLLKPGARACVQSIVIQDDLFERYIASTDFIQQYIFPGGCLPCPREFRREATAAGLDVVDEFNFGADYAETLRRWRDKFLRARQQVLALGFDEKFIRTWEFYLCSCEAAFALGNVDVMQFTLRKP